MLKTATKINMRIIRNIVLTLIVLIGLIFIYLSFKRIQLIKTHILIDSFAYSIKKGDTVSLYYPIDKNDIKDILFTVDCYSTDYGGSGFATHSIKSGDQVFDREFRSKESRIIYKGHELSPGDSFEDSITFKSKRNVFLIIHNRLKFKNEGIIKGAILDIENKRIGFDRPTILVTGSSYDSFSMNKMVVFIYYMLLFLLIALGLVFGYLHNVIKKEKSTATNTVYTP